MHKTTIRRGIATDGPMCLLEKLLKRNGFVLVHDGRRNPGQIQLPPDQVAFFTRKYRLRLDGEYVNTWITFRYDGRSQFADFEIHSREPNLHGREKMILQHAKEGA